MAALSFPPSRANGISGFLNTPSNVRTPRLDCEAIRAATRGQWPSILASLGVHPDHLKNRHGPCPGCGGRDRFRFDDREGRGTFVCSGGGSTLAGDGFALIMHCKGCGFGKALQMVTDVLGRGLPNMTITPSREVDLDLRREHARQRATQLWNEAQPYLTHQPFNAHPYLLTKGITAHGARIRNGLLVIPARDSEGVLHSLQFIAGDGTKRMMAGGRIGACYCAIGKVGDTLCIAEGFATAASVYESTGHATACAFSANNLKPVAVALRAKFPEVRIILCADDDEAGLRCAQDAAAAVGGFIVRPEVLS